MGRHLLMLGLSVAAHPLGISISKKQLEIKQQLEENTVLTARLEEQEEINRAPLLVRVNRAQVPSAQTYKKCLCKGQSQTTTGEHV